MYLYCSQTEAMAKDDESSSNIEEPEDPRENPFSSNSEVGAAEAEEGREEDQNENDACETADDYSYNDDNDVCHNKIITDEARDVTTAQMKDKTHSSPDTCSSVDRLVELLLKQCAKLARFCQVSSE